MVGFVGVPVGVEGVLDREWARRVGMVGRLLSSLVHSNSFYQRMDEILFGCLTTSPDLSVEATEMDI